MSGFNQWSTPDEVDDLISIRRGLLAKIRDRGYVNLDGSEIVQVPEFLGDNGYPAYKLNYSIRLQAEKSSMGVDNSVALSGEYMHSTIRSRRLMVKYVIITSDGSLGISVMSVQMTNILAMIDKERRGTWEIMLICNRPIARDPLQNFHNMQGSNGIISTEAVLDYDLIFNPMAHALAQRMEKVDDRYIEKMRMQGIRNGLPQMASYDPCVLHNKFSSGDVIRFIRSNDVHSTAVEDSVYYRVVK